MSKFNLQKLIRDQLNERAGGVLPSNDSTPDDGVENDSMLISAVDQLFGVVKIDRTFDIPYVAGYSLDHSTIYLDKNLKGSFKGKDGKSHKVDKFLILHEAVEKAIIDDWGLTYQHAHQIALRVEEEAVVAAGISLKEYNDTMDKWIKQVDDDAIDRVPADLDLTPYKDEKDFELIKLMKSKMVKTKHKD